MRFNRELSDLTDAELAKIEHACDRAINDGLIASRFGLRMALQLTESVARERQRRRRGRGSVTVRGATPKRGKSRHE